MSDSVLVALPEEVCVELIDEGPATAEAVLQPRGPVLAVAIEVITDASAVVSLVVGVEQITSLVRKLVHWLGSGRSGTDKIDVRLHDGFVVKLESKLTEEEFKKTADLILQHLAQRSQSSGGGM